MVDLDLDLPPQDPDSHDEMELDTDMRSDVDMRFRRPGSCCSSSRSLTREESVVSQSSRGSRGSIRRKLPNAPVEVSRVPLHLHH